MPISFHNFPIKSWSNTYWTVKKDLRNFVFVKENHVFVFVILIDVYSLLAVLGRVRMAVRLRPRNADEWMADCVELHAT